MIYKDYHKVAAQAQAEARKNLEKLCKVTSQKEVAVTLGVSAPYVNDLILRRRNFSEHMLEKLLV